MSSKTCTPNTVGQTSGGKFQTFTDLNNVKTSSNYAQCFIHGKSQPLNRPSTITVKNFKSGLPTGALITKITVKYKHSVVAYNNKVCNITAPTISLMKGDKVYRYSGNSVSLSPTSNIFTSNYKTVSAKEMSKKGQAPTTTAKEESVSFTHNWNYNEINSSDFGVRIDYPTNTNNNEGYVRLYYVKIIVTYKTANFSLKIQKEGGEYNGDAFTFFITCSNVNNVDYSPNVTIDAPPGFTLLDYNTLGKFKTVSNRTFTWTPKLGLGKQSDVLIIRFESNVTFPTGSTSYTGTFNAGESVNQHSASLNVTVTEAPAPTVDIEETTLKSDIINDEVTPPSELVKLVRGEVTYCTFNLTEEELDVSSFVDTPGFTHDDWGYVYIDTSSNIQILDGEGIDLFNDNSCRIDRGVVGNSSVSVELKGISNGRGHLEITLCNNLLRSWEIEVIPNENDLTTPFFTILSLSPEELHRLGHGYVYTIQSFLKEVTSENYVRNWHKNFRIGVFNNAIEENLSTSIVDDEEIVTDSTDYENLTYQEIFDNAEFWGNCPKEVNTFENVECNFRYDKNYPLYILIVGDYYEATTMAHIEFTEPCIVENQYYTGRLDNGVYPVPVDDLILNDGSTSWMFIESLGKSDTLVFYDLPLEEDYGTNTDYAIRGFAINGSLEYNSDDLILYASLVNGQNESKGRSIVLDETVIDDNNRFTIGQVGDLWGFSILDMVNLEDWEVHLIINNSLNNRDSLIDFGNVYLEIYVEQVEHQNIKCYVEDEDVSYYGAFIIDVDIPEGLKTDTDYITIDGTDTNDPFRQNIKEKTIQVEFDIGGCTLDESTLSLRELTRLLTNKRDKYNRPIPKKIRFSHYPDVYWEYIMEEPLDVSVDVSSYSAKAKLTIYQGTSYDIETTSANTIGYVSGLAAVRPVIQVSPVDSIFKIVEKESQQEFNMGYGGEWYGKIVEINCDDRIVLLKEEENDNNPVNISKYVDFNADWFVLFEEFEFEGIGCKIRSVDYQERW